MSADIPEGDPAQWQRATHEVLNQPTPLEGANLFRGDRLLRAYLPELGVDADDPVLMDYGALAGGELMELGRMANQYVPRLTAFDRFGRRIDAVEYHGAYHRIMRYGVGVGIHALPWSEPGDGQQVRRACLHFLHSQAEAGSGCPLTMTYACVPAIQSTSSVARNWLPGIFSTEYDPADAHAGSKKGLTIGMAMTEKQGGSDVRSNTTWAKPLGAMEPGGQFEIVGHKWFCSAPMSDAFLVLAQTTPGLSCFLLPRWRDESTRNQFHIQRLKDKLGNRSNASSEVEFRGALGWLLGEPGRGVHTILQMVALTRLDCMIGSTALMRQALSQAIHHCAQRRAFGRLLTDQVLMQQVLADMALNVDAALALTLFCADQLERSASDPMAATVLRLAIPVGKYWICKMAPALIHEAAECLGGAGYVEESILPRLYRDAPVNAIWEGSGNVQCLDVLRVLAREPDALPTVMSLLDAQTDKPVALDALRRTIDETCAHPDTLERNARRLSEDLALALAYIALQRLGSPWASDFLRLRCHRQCTNYETISRALDFGAILERARLG